MAQPYLDSAGNVNTAVANDIDNFDLAMRQRGAIPATNAAPSGAVAAGTVLAADLVTGMANAVTF